MIRGPATSAIAGAMTKSMLVPSSAQAIRRTRSLRMAIPAVIATVSAEQARAAATTSSMDPATGTGESPSTSATEHMPTTANPACASARICAARSATPSASPTARTRLRLNPWRRVDCNRSRKAKRTIISRMNPSGSATATNPRATSSLSKYETIATAPKVRNVADVSRRNSSVPIPSIRGSYTRV